jgi:excisionase family DNA binding protein
VSVESTPEILTPEDAAELLRLEPSQLYELTRTRARSRHKKPIPRIKVGKFIRFRRSSLLAWLSELESEGGQ